jgi:hypothetical protein
MKILKFKHKISNDIGIKFNAVFHESPSMIIINWRVGNMNLNRLVYNITTELRLKYNENFKI